MKNKLRLTTYMSAVALVFSLWTFSGCSKSSDAAPTMDILDLISSASFKQSATVSADKALDSLAKYINNYKDLKDLLSGSDKYTLFAPSNTAFINLLATPGFPANIKQINPALIEEVLYYHIISGQQLHSSLKSGASFTSYAPTGSTGEAIVVNADGTLLTGSTNSSIQIVTPDQKATNGVVHVTATVLIPPSVGTALTPILGTMAGTVLLGADFTDLAEIIGTADDGYTPTSAADLPITSWLATTPAQQAALGVTGGLTFFAIPNAVFQAAAQQAGITEAQVVASFTASSANARALLLNHLAVGKYVVTAASGSTTFANGTINTKGKSITVTVTTPSTQTGPYGVVLTNANTPTPSSSAYIAVKDVVATNGVVQVIAGILK